MRKSKSGVEGTFTEADKKLALKAMAFAELGADSPEDKKRISKLFDKLWKQKYR